MLLSRTGLWHDRVSVSIEEGETSYFVYQLDGRFTDLPMDLRVLISKRCLGQIGLTAGALDTLRPAYLAHSLVAFCVSIKLSILKMLAVCSDRFLIKESCAGAII
jgi:hypothetical protein